MTSTVISRRISSSIAALSAQDYEEAFIHLFPAIDRTAKLRRPKATVAGRIKGFICDEQALVMWVATGHIIGQIKVNDWDLPSALYKFGRTSIAHEGELDPRLRIHDTGELSIGDVWNLPSSYILGLIIAVVISEENSKEHLGNDYRVSFNGASFNINALWGNRAAIESHASNIFGRPQPFRTS